MALKSTQPTKQDGLGEVGSILTVRGLVRAARGSSTQRDFGAALGGIGQDLISRYEAGLVDPPAKVIEACLRMLKGREESRLFSAEAVARRIERELQGEEHLELRRAFVYMLDGIKPKKVGRPRKD